MNKLVKFAFFLLILLSAVFIGLVVLNIENIAVLSPEGMIGQKQSNLLVLSIYLMLIIVIPVFILAWFVVWKYEVSKKHTDYDPEWNHSTIAEIIWWGVPCIIVIILGVMTWKGSHALDPFKPIVSDTKPLRIQVVALQWKWLFIYPEQNIATVNFIQFPEKTPIAFEITSDAPMNSFWIPDLGGQIYAMSGMKSQLHLIADGIGSYRGLSANISGDGFSGMTFVAQSSSLEDFEEWVASAQNSPDPLNFQSYRELAKPSSYNVPAIYQLGEEGLFDWIVMKYVMPMPAHKEKGMNHVFPTY
jgi:cytochrome o ubiquinol oxidase subunit 2